MGGTIIMSQKEIQRSGIIAKALNKRLSKTDASKLLHLSYRQTLRIVEKVKNNGLEALVHRNRGKSSNKKFPQEFMENILCLHQQYYYDCGPTFTAELLSKRNNIKISKESLRQLFINCDIPYTTRKINSAPCHVWREPKQHIGELVQIDGSHHAWLRLSPDLTLCLIASIDDASRTVFARFYEYEGTFPILDFSKRFIQKFGLPHAVYLDRHSTYKTTREASVDEELRSLQPETQFQRVMRSLGVQVIAAGSPQAKGRVERLFGTLQTRLIIELRLAGISSLEQANLFLDPFLPEFNAQFAKQPKNPTSFYKPLPPDFDSKWIFSIEDKRIIAPDFTIRWNNRLFLLLNPTISLKRRQVVINQAINGSLRFSTKDKILSVKEITQQHLEIAKANRKYLQKIARQCAIKSNKKSWMDQYYLSGQRNFYS